MMKLFLTLYLAFFAMPAMAQISEIPPECRMLADHKPDADVAYKPGVDVKGKAVVPADVNSHAMGANETIVVPLGTDLAQRLQNSNVRGLDMTTTLGFLEISPNGQITYNGQDLTSQVYVLCGKGPGVSGAGIGPEQLPPADGQKRTDTVKFAPVKEIKPAAPAPKPVKPPAPAPLPAPKPAEKGELLEGQDFRDQ